MVDIYDYANYYGVDPWDGITQNERPWYDPFLRASYQRSAVYSIHTTFKVDMNGPKARTIYFDDLIPPRPNIAPINPRSMQATRLYMDSFRKEVRTQRYGNGMSIHRESEMFSFWQENGRAGLIPIINRAVGPVITDHIDLLARNAYFENPVSLFGQSKTNFANVASTDKITTEILDAIVLGMKDRVVPFSPVAKSYVQGKNEILCITTSGVVHDLKREVGEGTGGINFVDVHKYTDATPLVRGELGMWRGVRFIENPMAKLYNAGTVIHQATITAAVQPGDGAPDPETTKVDSVRMVGQPGATHHIAVDDASGFAANDWVTIHRVRHDGTSNPRGVADGVDYTDPMAQNVQIHSVDTTPGANKIVLKEPYMMTMDNGKGLEVDLGGGVYGYVTKGRNIHTAVFLNLTGANGLVNGTSQPPVLYTPIANDDFESIYRLTYDMWMKFQLWEPDAFEVWFGAGANRNRGAIYY